MALLILTTSTMIFGDLSSARSQSLSTATPTETAFNSTQSTYQNIIRTWIELDFVIKDLKVSNDLVSPQMWKEAHLELKAKIEQGLLSFKRANLFMRKQFKELKSEASQFSSLHLRNAEIADINDQEKAWVGLFSNVSKVYEELGSLLKHSEELFEYLKVSQRRGKFKKDAL